FRLFLIMPPLIKLKGRSARVWNNLKQGMSLAWAASPKLLIRYTILGMFNSIIPPLQVWLGALLVNKIAEARLHPFDFNDMLPIIITLWLSFIIQRTIGSYIGYGRNLYVRRVELEAERRLLDKASRVDLGHFDNSDWHDRLARARRDVSWRPGDLTWSVLALATSLLSLIIESRVTSRLYKYYYQETPEERERNYIGELLIQPRTIKEIKAYVLADYLLGRHKKISDHLFKQREKMYQSGVRISMLSGIVTGTTLALAYVFVGLRGIQGTIDSGGVVLVICSGRGLARTLGQLSQTFVAVDQHTRFLG